MGMVLASPFLTAGQGANPQPSSPPLPPSPPPSAAPRFPASPAGPFSKPTPAPQAPVIPTAPAPAPVVPVQVTTPQSFPSTAFPTVAGLPAAGPLTALKFDAEKKEYSSKPGEMQAPFTFHLTNTSSADVSVTAVRTSCGCTVAKLPSTPWVIPPGQGGPIDVSVNLAGKSGTITKSVTVESSAGVKSLLVTVNIAGGAPHGLTGAAPHPVMGDSERLKNMQLALADRQALFKNQDCAKCHADPAKGLTDGRQIYAAVCSTCHDSPIRAAMVPDLRTIKNPTDAEYFRNWVTYGRAGSMMPAFAQSEGGPLSEAQISALVSYLVPTYRGNRLPGMQRTTAALGAPSSSVVSPVVAVPPAVGTPAPANRPPAQ